MPAARRRIVLAFAAAVGLAVTAAAPARAPSPAIGSAAPPFRLQDQKGKRVALDDHEGEWLVLYFHPKDNMPGCTTQACEFRDDIFAFRDAGAVILGISVDDVDSHEDFAREHSLPLPVLADPTRTTAKAYGVLHKAMGPLEIARRETFIVDPQGRIAKHCTQVNPKGHSQLVLADIRSLQAG